MSDLSLKSTTKTFVAVDCELDINGEYGIGGISPRNMARFDRARMACASAALGQIESGKATTTTPATYTPFVSDENFGIPGIPVNPDGKQTLPALPADPVETVPTPTAPASTAPAAAPKYPEAAK